MPSYRYWHFFPLNLQCSFGFTKKVALSYWLYFCIWKKRGWNAFWAQNAHTPPTETQTGPSSCSQIHFFWNSYHQECKGQHEHSCRQTLTFTKDHNILFRDYINNPPLKFIVRRVKVYGSDQRCPIKTEGVMTGKSVKRLGGITLSGAMFKERWLFIKSAPSAHPTEFQHSLSAASPLPVSGSSSPRRSGRCCRGRRARSGKRHRSHRAFPGKMAKNVIHARTC